MKDEIFKIILEILQVQSHTDSKLHSNSVSALLKGGLQWIAQTMQGSPQCKITAAKAVIPFCQTSLN